MREIEINLDDTVSFKAELPRDLRSTSVQLLLGEDKSESGNVVVTDGQAGKVQFVLENLDFELGPNTIYWKITYDNGGVELLPPEGDTLFAYR